MDAQRLRLLRAAVPVALGTAAGSLVFAGAPADPWPWRTAATLASALVGISVARWLHQTAAAGAPRRVPVVEWANGLLHPDRRGTATPGQATPGQATSTVITEFLRDIRDSLGATEAVFWQLFPDGDGLCAAAWASGGDEPLLPADDSILSLIGWSAHERLVQCTGGERGTAVAAAPVLNAGELLGALSVHAERELSGSPEQVKLWLSRHAGRVGEIVDLTHTRIEFELQSNRSQRLLQAAQEFQSLRSVEELARAICTSAVGVSSAQRAALVRWNARDGTGRVESACGDRGVLPGQPVTGASQAGMACQNALPQLWEDARLLDGATPVFGPGEPPRAIGSLGIIPLTGRDGVVGAVVVEGTAAGTVRLRDMRSIKLLAALGAISLETLGDFELAERHANTDKLTGLPNRRAFDAQFGPTLDAADRFGEPVALLMCDVDSFKVVNDTHGHDVGDVVLQSIGATLRRGARAVDLCARFGGEEFMLLLPRTGRVGAMELAERLRRAVELRPVKAGGRELRVTASFGIAIYPATVTSRDALIAAADRALYQAKRDGRNCVRCADATAVFD